MSYLQSHYKSDDRHSVLLKCTIRGLFLSEMIITEVFSLNGSTDVIQLVTLSMLNETAIAFS